MKTAKELVSEIGTYSTGNDNWNKVSTRQIESIQLAAAKRALELAAIAALEIHGGYDCGAKKAIKKLRDNLTIEQLNEREIGNEK